MNEPHTVQELFLCFSVVVFVHCCQNVYSNSSKSAPLFFPVWPKLALQSNGDENLHDVYKVQEIERSFFSGKVTGQILST